MSTLDLDKRKVFSTLERKAKELKLSNKDNSCEIKISLLSDFYKGGFPLLKNEDSLDDIFLYIEEQTNRRFVYKVGYDRKQVGEGSRSEYDDKGELIREYDYEEYDLIYTLIFNPKIKEIDPKDFIDREALFYINFDNDIFYYNGLPLELTKTANYYKAFCILYALIPNGGEALFSDLIKKTRENLRPYKTKDEPEIIKYLQDNLTSKKNGFQRKANIPDLLDNGKPILVNIRGRGIQFNNEK
jgi:hypothetical protein